MVASWRWEFLQLRIQLPPVGVCTCGPHAAAVTLVTRDRNRRTGSEMEVAVSVNERNDH